MQRPGVVLSTEEGPGVVGAAVLQASLLDDLGGGAEAAARRLVAGDRRIGPGSSGECGGTIGAALGGQRGAVVRRRRRRRVLRVGYARLKGKEEWCVCVCGGDGLFLREKCYKKIFRKVVS